MMLSERTKRLVMLKTQVGLANAKTQVGLVNAKKPKFEILKTVDIMVRKKELQVQICRFGSNAGPCYQCSAWFAPHTLDFHLIKFSTQTSFESAL